MNENDGAFFFALKSCRLFKNWFCLSRKSSDGRRIFRRSANDNPMSGRINLLAPPKGQEPHPIIEMKTMEELNSIIPSNEPERFRLFDVQDLNKLVYLHGSLCESLRLYPPVPFVHKQPLEPDTLPSGHRVRPNIKITFSLYLMGRMESIWGKDCMEMCPERWISEHGTIKHEPSNMFLAFNAGPRT